MTYTSFFIRKRLILWKNSIELIDRYLLHGPKARMAGCVCFEGESPDDLFSSDDVVAVEIARSCPGSVLVC